MRRTGTTRSVYPIAGIGNRWGDPAWSPDVSRHRPLARQPAVHGITFASIIDAAYPTDHLGCIGGLPEMQAAQGVEANGVHLVGDPSNCASHA
jgi:hypothetical protein